MTGLAPLLGAIALIGLGGLFAAIDAAINTLSIARVEELVREERPGAVRLARMMAERPRYINLVVLLRIACEATATVLLVAFLWDDLGLKWGLFAAAAIMTVASFVAMGVGPRTVGRQNAYSIALASAVPLQAISVLLTPISRLLILLGNALTPGRGFRNGPFASEIELREVVDLAQQGGVVADTERKMIQSVFELGDTPAREVMVPRTEMVWIESDKTAGQATSLAVRSGHSRIPVIGENVDDVIGVVYLKDLVQKTYYSANSGADTTVAPGSGTRPSSNASSPPTVSTSRSSSNSMWYSSPTSSIDNRAETRNSLFPRSSIGATSSVSYSSAISPTISSNTSSMVTSPAIPPYSSTSRAMWLRSCCISRSSSSSGLESGTKTAGRMISDTLAPRPLSDE